MTSPMYINSVPVFKQLLTALKAVLAQADTYAVTNSIEPDAFLQARLYPNMFPLVKQVQIAADFARGISARLQVLMFPSMKVRRRALPILMDCWSRHWNFLIA
jgi:uncharacterized protein